MIYRCWLFGKARFQQKKTLVLEFVPHRYKAATLDLSGADVVCHGNELYKIIGVIRNWLGGNCCPNAVAPAKLKAAYFDFMKDDYDALIAEGFSKDDIYNLEISELIERMQRWVKLLRS